MCFIGRLTTRGINVNEDKHWHSGCGGKGGAPARGYEIEIEMMEMMEMMPAVLADWRPTTMSPTSSSPRHSSQPRKLVCSDHAATAPQPLLSNPTTTLPPAISLPESPLPCFSHLVSPLLSHRRLVTQLRKGYPFCSSGYAIERTHQMPSVSKSANSPPEYRRQGVYIWTA